MFRSGFSGRFFGRSGFSIRFFAGSVFSVRFLRFFLGVRFFRSVFFSVSVFSGFSGQVLSVFPVFIVRRFKVLIKTKIASKSTLIWSLRALRAPKYSEFRGESEFDAPGLGLAIFDEFRFGAQIGF